MRDDFVSDFLTLAKRPVYQPAAEVQDGLMLFGRDAKVVFTVLDTCADGFVVQIGVLSVEYCFWGPVVFRTHIQLPLKTACTYAALEGIVKNITAGGKSHIAPSEIDVVSNAKLCAAKEWTRLLDYLEFLGQER